MPFKPLQGRKQTDLLLAHFKSDPTITGVKAAAVYRIRDLPKRISELSAQGHVFVKTRCEDPTGQRYTEYRYTGKQRMTPRPAAFEGPTPAFMEAR